MAVSFLTNLSEEEFKNFLKETISEILGDKISSIKKSDLPDILNGKEAADFLRLKISTLYEKTSEKTIPHFKKGNKLYFHRSELETWVKDGKVKTTIELQCDAASYTMHKQRTVK